MTKLNFEAVYEQAAPIAPAGVGGGYGVNHYVSQLLELFARAKGSGHSGYQMIEAAILELRQRRYAEATADEEDGAFAMGDAGLDPDDESYGAEEGEDQDADDDE